MCCVMARDNQGHDIFRDDGDRWRWLETLREAQLKRVDALLANGNPFKLLAYSG
jgi:hypothetical protein